MEIEIKGVTMKITMYGAPICGDCVISKLQLQENKHIQLNYKNIVESTDNLKEFLALRDQEAMFDEVKKSGRIGIPFFVLEDGTKTFDIGQYVEFKVMKVEQPVKSCSMDGHC